MHAPAPRQTQTADFMDIPEEGGLREALLGDPQRVTAPISTLRDKYELLPAFLAVRGLVKQHIDSFNYLVEHDVRRASHPTRALTWRLLHLSPLTGRQFRHMCRRCARLCRPRQTRK